MVGSPADSNFALIEPKIPALVVTYDGHRVFLQNMLASYVEYWPLHPFQFYVPYNGEFPSDVLQYGDFVTLVKTPLGINETVLSLLKSCACSDRICLCQWENFKLFCLAGPRKEPKIMAQYPKIESIGSIGSITLAILWRSRLVVGEQRHCLLRHGRLLHQQRL